ncbi:MAG: tyrosine-type recombinase/integrase [Bacteroidales bacterium]|nr:tyrosine-type recombinase/integrase [Bacteroidales bacterium]
MEEVTMTPQEEILQNMRAHLFGKGVEVSLIRDIEAWLTDSMRGYDLERKETAMVVYDNGDSEIIGKFFVAKAVQGCTESTLNTYKTILKMALSAIGKHVRDVSADDIRIFLAKKKVDGCSSAYLAIIYRTLNSLYSWCRKQDLVPANPMDRVERVKVRNRKEEALSVEQMEHVRSAARTARIKALVEMLYSTGCRVSELCALNRTDVDWEKMEVTVLGKGRKYRTVYITQRAKYAYFDYLKVRKDKSPALFGYEPDLGTLDIEKMFSSQGREYRPDEGRLSPDEARGILRKLGEACGFRLHPHLFRKTVATHALQKGMPIDEVRIMLGHDSIATTTIYAQTLNEDVKDAHKKFIG